MSVLERLDGLRHGRREVMEVYEREPAREHVAPVDFLREDGLGRTVVACPKGTVPATWLQLTNQERKSLIPPPPRPAAGTLQPLGRGLGFTPTDTRLGFTFEEH